MSFCLLKVVAPCVEAMALHKNALWQMLYLLMKVFRQHIHILVVPYNRQINMGVMAVNSIQPFQHFQAFQSNLSFLCVATRENCPGH